LTALVRMCGPRNDWSASTPMPQTPFSFAASSAPRPQPPATWKMTPAVQDRDAGVRRPGARLVAGDEAVDRRLLLAADRTDHVLAGTTLLLETGEIADEVARLLLAEEQAEQVLRLVRLFALVDVDDREVRIRKVDGSRVDRLRFGEPDSDREAIPLARERREIRNVFLCRLRLEHATLDTEVALGALEPEVRQMVEAAVVEAADVRDEADLDVRAGTSGRGRAARGLVALATSAAGRDEQNDDAEECERSLHLQPFR
jgi:hypothetical protein